MCHGEVRHQGTRLNKCVVELSRRAADTAITKGQVSINGIVESNVTRRCYTGDIVTWLGREQPWERKTRTDANGHYHKYIKYWKPQGVVCTTSSEEEDNIIQAGNFDMKTLGVRVFPVGRLDKDASGLVLLTSDGTINSRLLGAGTGLERPPAEKIYTVDVTGPYALNDKDIRKLRSGVPITTHTTAKWIKNSTFERKMSKIITAKTLPCHVELLRAEPCSKIVLTAGRNRQIRRMVEEGGLKVTRIHRSSFSGVTLEGLRCEGSFAELTAQEMQRIQLNAQGYGAESSASTTASNTGRLRNKD
eukprot:GSChrysophyteH1.ASY1.ANO1.2851.1 assembled CDS